VRVPTSEPHTINACWFLFLLFAYLLVAEAASFDKKELCRSDTALLKILMHYWKSWRYTGNFGGALSEISVLY
jgi:hypothetical protein